MSTSPVTSTTIIANAVVIGCPLWTPAVLAALAQMFAQYQRTPAAPECTPAPSEVPHVQ